MIMNRVGWRLVVAVCLAACGGDDAVVEATSVEQLVGPEGGTVELRNGGKVEIPAGALSERVSIKISERSSADVAALPNNLEAAGKAYSFEPHGQVFAAPVKLDVPFEGDAAEVRPVKLPDDDAPSSAWTTVFPHEKTTDKLSMQTTSFSVVVAARPLRVSGVVTLPDGAVVPVDGGTPDSGDAGMGGMGGTAGNGGAGGTGGSEPDAGLDASSVLDGALVYDAGDTADGGNMSPHVVGIYDDGATAHWNRWVLNDGTDAFDASGAPCNLVLNEIDRRDACVHTGELLEVRFPGLGNCDDLTITDTADALHWTCTDTGDALLVRSEGLRDGAGITDVVDWDAGTFRALSVVVSRDGQELARTAPEVWWQNEVVTVDNTTPTSFTGDLRVYLALADPARFINIGGNGAVYAVRPGVQATAPDATSVARLGGTLHGWLEGEFDGTALSSSSTNVVQMASLLCTVRRVSIRNAVLRGLGLACAGGRVEDVSVQDTAGEGVYSSGLHMSFRRVHVHHTSGGGFYHFTPTGSLLQDVRVHDTGGLCMMVKNSVSGGDLNPAINRNVVLRNVRLSNCGFGGASLFLAASTIDGLHVRETNNPALNLYLQQSVVRDVTVVGVNGACIDARNSNHSVFSSILCGAGGSASNSAMVSFDQNTRGAVVSGVSVFNNTREGVRVDGADNTLVSITSVNNGEGGLRVVPRGNQLWNLALSSNNVNEITDTFADLRTSFTGATLVPNLYGGILLVGLGPRGCARDGGVSVVNAGITDLCNTDNGTFPGLVSQTEIPHLTLAGPVLADDPVNTADTAGRATRTSIDDWIGFSHDARGWAIDAGNEPANSNTFPGPTFRGQCRTQEFCRIWDFDLSAADLSLSNRLPWPPTDASATIPLVLTHTFAGATQPQCNDIVGATWDGTNCSVAFLNHAIELADGNGNGLCESGETCLHAPNYGRYQGHGTLNLVDSDVTAAPLSGIALYRYAQNGR